MFLTTILLSIKLGVGVLIPDMEEYQVGHSTALTRYIKKKSIPMTTLWCPAFSNHG